jgi:hypothetical protein
MPAQNNEDERFLVTADLTTHEWRGLRELARSFNHFEPLARRIRVGPLIADRLVEMRLAETGPPERPYAKGGKGYRLTKLGWQIIKRGRHPPGWTRRKPPPTMEPLVKPLEPILRSRKEDE